MIGSQNAAQGGQKDMAAVQQVHQAAAARNLQPTYPPDQHGNAVRQLARPPAAAPEAPQGPYSAYSTAAARPSQSSQPLTQYMSPGNPLPGPNSRHPIAQPIPPDRRATPQPPTGGDLPPPAPPPPPPRRGPYDPFSAEELQAREIRRLADGRHQQVVERDTRDRERLDQLLRASSTRVLSADERNFLVMHNGGAGFGRERLGVRGVDHRANFERQPDGTLRQINPLTQDRNWSAEQLRAERERMAPILEEARRPRRTIYDGLAGVRDPEERRRILEQRIRGLRPG